MHSLEIKRVLRASAERVFRAWTCPEELKAWHCPAEFTVSYAECDPRLGGRFLVNMVDPEGGDHRVVGEYLEFEENSRLVFTWDWIEGGGGSEDTRVTVVLKPLGENESEITLIHERFIEIESCEDHRQGWTGALTHLEHHLNPT